MIVSLVVAMDEQGGIGKNGALPWHLSADLKRFKQITWGSYLIMGRKTYDSIGAALPGRTNVVISRQPAFSAPGCLVACSLTAALSLAEMNGEGEAFVIGGSQIFQQALPLANRLYLTRVHARLDCDVFFPPLAEGDWQAEVTSEFPADEKNDYPSTFTLLVRKNR